MPLSPKQRQGGKGVDASLYVVATSMGVAQSELEKLLAGRASVGIAKKLGVSRMDLQRFIEGEVSMTMAYALGCCNPKLRICETMWNGKVL